MKRSRLPFVVAGAVGVLLVLALVVAFNSSFQTWAVRRAIAKNPDLRVTVGSVSVGLKTVELTDVRMAQPGAVLTLPRVEVGVDVVEAAWEKKVEISRLVAKGWTLELTNSANGAAVGSAVPQASNNATKRKDTVASGQATPSAATSSPAQDFPGVFSHLRAPIDLSVDGVELQGDVILSDSRGRVKVNLTGGGFRPGQEGTFDLLAEGAMTDERVKSVKVRGSIIGMMDTSRTLTRIGAKLDASATGTKFPEGVKLQAEVAAGRVETGETYSASLTAAGQDVMAVKAALVRNARTFEGTWKVDVRDVDVAPFAFGVSLPEFSAKGEGKFDGDAGFEAIHVSGRLNTTLDGLESVIPELAAMGEIKIAADFDLSERAGSFGVKTFAAAIRGPEPVATLRVLQPFEFNPQTGEIHTADTMRELIGVALHALPVAWMAPFIKDARIEGGHVRGELSAIGRGGGMTVRSTSPLLVDGVSVAQAGMPLVERVNLALSASADYTAKGWQAEVSELKAMTGETTFLALAAKIGQLAGPDQALKATGTLNAQLPALFAQPGLAGNIVLTSGDATMEFVVSLDAKRELQANMALRNLATVVNNVAVALPALATNLRADIAEDGKISFNAPIQIERSGRKSDLTVIGTVGPEVDRLRAIEAVVTSTQLIIEDAQVLAAVLPEKTGAAGSPAPVDPIPATVPPVTLRDAAPPWVGLHGALELQLKSIVFSDAVQVSNVTGRLRIDSGMLKLEAMRAGLGENGRANLNGMVTFNAAAPQPYALTADIALREFDPGPLFRAMTGNQPATVEGKFDVTSNLAGRAATFAELAGGAGGDFQVTSKGGVFRGLPVDVSDIVGNTSKLAAWLSSAGTAIGAITGKKDYAEVANKAEAVAELAKRLNPIPYDQLSVSLTRDAALNTTLRNFTLISPEVRLTGNGTALHKPGSTLLEDSLAMEFTLRARGRQGELLKYLGALDAQTDDLGYATCTMPLKIGGSLGSPDTSELNNRLMALAIEKSGFGDKAAEFLNKIRGGK